MDLVNCNLASKDRDVGKRGRMRGMQWGRKSRGMVGDGKLKEIFAHTARQIGQVKV